LYYTREKEVLTPECITALQSRHNMWSFTDMVIKSFVNTYIIICFIFKEHSNIAAAWKAAARWYPIINQ